MDLIIGLVVTVVLLLLGFSAGTIAERRHFRRLDHREQASNDIIRTNSKKFLAPSQTSSLPPAMICAETVIASDYFKNFLAAFRKIFGGEMRSYNSLMDRARRETLTKMIEQAKARGYNAICNVRLEPADIGGSLGENRGTAMVCILGTATAYTSGIKVQRMPTPINLK